MKRRSSNYDKFPSTRVPVGRESVWQGWREIIARIGAEISRGARKLSVETYPGVFENEVLEAFVETLHPAHIFRTNDCWKTPAEIDAIVGGDLGDDPVFGRMSQLTIEDFADSQRTARLRDAWKSAEGVTLTLGTGTELVAPEPDVLILADLARWEIQRRQRANQIGNFPAGDIRESPAAKYKRAFFVDWRVADRIKRDLLKRIDYLLDTHDLTTPKMTSGQAFRTGLQCMLNRPFRVVPFFDPGPWGGQWMREVCDLPDGPPNYAWCFDCVPEENSVLLNIAGVNIEIPAMDLVLQHSRELLGDAVHARFGTEFPIRFDFLDTMQGGNLSLQVHPLNQYIIDNFGMAYTQDESYYLLDAAPDACVYLGLKTGIDREAMIEDLHHAQQGGAPFQALNYVNRWPARKHDHFLIPAGTIHCSGANSMVLEISATPYIFTFKLWDWGRPGLDGRPRPIHLERGAANIQWDRDTEWVRKNLLNRIEKIGEGRGWREERTGLHELEFIETRRHWFNSVVEHDASAGVHVLNLVEGEEAIVESPCSGFEPFHIHYAETFIVPAQAGGYSMRPADERSECATIRAAVRTET
ncbi:MAG TPA: class I mannose-6-phosphate isomerase [Candidatus Sulfotelmatobacter sp.]|nr:class I mannose-6-phosphate isomerase [Candidatus Sulfotelmatobacter sp.]